MNYPLGLRIAFNPLGRDLSRYLKRLLLKREEKDIVLSLSACAVPSFSADHNDIQGAKMMIKFVYLHQVSRLEVLVDSSFCEVHVSSSAQLYSDGHEDKAGVC